MKFKVINSIDDVFHIIKTDTMVNAPLDEKSLTTDWIGEQIFDDFYTEKKDVWLGFIDDIPTYIKTNGHCMMVQPVGRGIDTTTDACILGKFSEVMNVDDDNRCDDDREVIAVCETDKRRGFYFIRFYFGRYIGK